MVRWKVQSAKRLVLVLLVATATSIAMIAAADEYTVSKRWPTGHALHTMEMHPQDASICNALVNAIAAQGDLQRPLRLCSEPPLQGAGVSEAGWKPLHVDDPVAFTQRLFRVYEQTVGADASFVDDPGWIAGLKKRLERGGLRLETAMVENLVPDAPTTSLVRMVTEDCANSDEAVRALGGTKLFYAEDKDLGKLHYLFGDFESAFSLSRQSYVMGQKVQRVGDTGVILERPRVELYAYRPLRDDDEQIRMLPICRLIYRHKDSK
jgi:hypothetical protein